MRRRKREAPQAAIYQASPGNRRRQTHGNPANHANIVKCRPPHNRDPLGTEQDACIGYLRKQTKLLNPKIIVCLGRIAAMKLIREDFKISRDHGTWEQKGGIWFTAMYHPSALLRDVTKRPDTFRDLKSLQAKAAELCTHTP